MIQDINLFLLFVIFGILLSEIVTDFLSKGD